MIPVGEAAIGWAVDVYWDEEEEWFSGEIVEFEPGQGYKIVYDDGDITWEPQHAPNIRYNNKIERGCEEPEADRGSFDEAKSTVMMPPDDSDDEDDSFCDPAEAKDTTFEYTNDEIDASSQEAKEESLKESSLEDSGDKLDELSNQKLADLTQADNELDQEEKMVEQEDVLEESDVLNQFSIINEQIADGMMNHKPPGPGRGTLNCKIIGASGLLNPIDSDTCDPFVKVSVVEAGNRNIMMRCKTTIHTTSTIHNDTDPCWDDDETFSIQVDPYYENPRKKANPSWDKVQGDLLFAVYDANQGDRNEFLGLVTFPIRDLIDGDVSSIQAGAQGTQKEWYDLKNRGGIKVNGALHIELQLTLPNYMHLPILQVIEAPKVVQEPIVPPSPKSARSSRVSSRVSSKVKKKVATKKAEDLLALRSSNAAKAKERTKQIEKEKLAKENEIMQKRLAAVAPKKKRTPLTEKQLQKKDKRIAKASQKRCEKRLAKEGVKDKKQTELVNYVIGLQEAISTLEASKVGLKAKAIRLDTTNKKLSKSIGEFKRNAEKRQAKSNTTRPSSHPYTVLAKKEKKVQKGNQATPAASKMTLEQIELLQTEHDSLLQTKKNIQTKIDNAEEEERSHETKIDEIQSLLDKIHHRQVFKGHCTPRNGDPDCDTEEHQALEEARKELRKLEIEVEVLRQSQETYEKMRNSKESGENERLNTLVQKCSRKNVRIQESQAEATKYRVLFEQLIADDERGKIRTEILQVQNEVYLKERQKHVLKQVTLDADIAVSKLAAEFNDKMRQETTDSDRILNNNIAD